MRQACINQGKSWPESRRKQAINHPIITKPPLRWWQERPVFVP